MTGALRYFVTEAVLSSWRSRRATLLSVFTIATALFVLGAVLLVTFNVDRAAVAWRAASEMSVYLRHAITADEQAAVGRLLAASPLVAATEFVSRDEARRRFQDLFPDLALASADLPENPFPASFEVRLAAAAVTPEAASAFVRQIEREPGVADVQYDQRWLDRLASVTAGVRWVGVALSLVLGAAAALTVANVVRLALFARRDEVEIMQLVGAPLSYIRGPFVCEGILHGGAGSLLALVALFAGSVVAALRYGTAVAGMLGGESLQFLPVSLCLLLLIGGMAVGCLGGWVAARGVR